MCLYGGATEGGMKPSAAIRDRLIWGNGSIKLRVEQEAEFIVIEVPVNH